LLDLVAADLVDLAFVQEAHVDLRLVSLLVSTSRTWLNWKSESAKRGQLVFLLLDARVAALEIERVEISLFDCSTAFFTSIMSASETTSNDGIINVPFC